MAQQANGKQQFAGKRKHIEIYPSYMRPTFFFAPKQRRCVDLLRENADKNFKDFAYRAQHTLLLKFQLVRSNFELLSKQIVPVLGFACSAFFIIFALRAFSNLRCAASRSGRCNLRTCVQWVREVERALFKSASDSGTVNLLLTVLFFLDFD